MKYIQSNSQRTYAVNGAAGIVLIIPARRSREYLIVDDSDYAAILKTPTIKSLIECGSISVQDNEPVDWKNNPDNLQKSRALLQKQLDEANAKIQELESGGPVDVSALKQEALDEIAKRDAEIAELKARLAAAEVETEAGEEE